MSKYLDENGLAYVWTKAKGTFGEQEEGMTLSENNYSDEDKAKLDGMFDVGVFARNIGDIEGELETVRAENAGIIQALAEANVRALNVPNLLNKDAWWVNNGSTNLVCGDAARYSKSGGAYMKSIKNYVIYSTEPTQEQTAGATYVYHREAYTSDNVTYPEAWYVYRDADDNITTSCVTLTGDAIITENNGETFDKALQYNITQDTAWGNMETLYYPQGYSTQHYKQGETPKSYGYYIEEMEVGKTYTMSCWARLTSGTEAWLKFGWGGHSFNQMGSLPNVSGVSDVYKVTSSEWKRISWSFVFNPTGAEYTETTESATDSGGQTYTKVIRTYNWSKRVMIGVHRKYTAVLQLAGFRLTAGGLYGSNTVDTLSAEVAALRASISAAQAINTRLAAAESAITALQSKAAAIECAAALGYKTHGIVVKAVYDSGSSALLAFMNDSANKVDGTFVGERVIDTQTGAVTYNIWGYKSASDYWWSWPDEFTA